MRSQTPAHVAVGIHVPQPGFVLNRLRNHGIDYYASDRVIPNRPRDLPGVRGEVLVYTDGNDYTVVVENVRYE